MIYDFLVIHDVVEVLMMVVRSTEAGNRFNNIVV